MLARELKYLLLQSSKLEFLATEKLGKVRLNTSPVKEAAMKRIGEKKLFEDLEKEWEKFRSDET